MAKERKIRVKCLLPHMAGETTNTIFGDVTFDENCVAEVDEQTAELFDQLDHYQVVGGEKKAPPTKAEIVPGSDEDMKRQAEEAAQKKAEEDKAKAGAGIQ